MTQTQTNPTSPSSCNSPASLCRVFLELGPKSAQVQPVSSLPSALQNVIQSIQRRPAATTGRVLARILSDHWGMEDPTRFLENPRVEALANRAVENTFPTKIMAKTKKAVPGIDKRTGKMLCQIYLHMLDYTSTPAAGGLERALLNCMAGNALA